MFRFWRLGLVAFFLTQGVFLGIASSTDSSIPCETVGQRVLFAGSLLSWDAYWEKVAPPGFSEKLIASTKKNLFPAIASLINPGTKTVRTFPLMEALSNEVDWAVIRRAGFSVVVWVGETEPETIDITLKFSPDGDLTDLYNQIHKIVDIFCRHSDGTLALTDTDPGKTCQLKMLKLPPMSLDLFSKVLSTTTPVEMDPLLINCFCTDDAVYLSSELDPEKLVSQTGLTSDPLYQSLQTRIGNDPWLSCTVIHYQNIGTTLSEMMDLMIPTGTASLVIDETVESQFKDDPELLDKLKKATSDLESLGQMYSKKDYEVFYEIFQIIRDQGISLSLTSQEGEGFYSHSWWYPLPGAKYQDLFTPSVLPEQTHSLLDPRYQSIAIYSFPNLSKIYQTILHLVESIDDPDIPPLLPLWENIQKDLGLNLQDDVLPVIGNWGAMLTRTGEPQTGLSFMPSTGNETLFIQAISDSQKASGVLTRIEQELAKHGMVPEVTGTSDQPINTLQAGMLGEFAWMIDKDPPIFVLSSRGLSGITKPVFPKNILRGHAMAQHPDWKEMSRIWVENPTSISYTDLKKEWPEIKNEFKILSMMTSIMGSASKFVSGLVDFIQTILDGIYPPRVAFSVDYMEDGIYCSRGLYLMDRNDGKKE